MSTALDDLSKALDDDLMAVNALILERMESHVPLIKQVATYLIAAGGKRIRPLLTLASTALYSGEMRRAHLLAACVEFIHTATLLHDDVVDKSNKRRGKKTANLVFGNEASVLVGDFLFARAFKLMTKDGSIEILRILSSASSTITEGEVLQLSVSGKIDTPKETYIEVIKGKTAALFAAACEVGPAVAGAPKSDLDAMADYGLNLGIAFQIADDVLDYSPDKKKLGKDIGNDFREGKITAPVLYALEEANDDERSFWTRVIEEKQIGDNDLDHALTLIEKHDGLQKGVALANHYADMARKALANAPDNAMKQLLLALIDNAVRREF